MLTYKKIQFGKGAGALECLFSERNACWLFERAMVIKPYMTTHVCSGWVEWSCLEVVDLLLKQQQKSKAKNSIELMASLASS